MEYSLSSLAFRGSITEAIAESKQQKKLFVVYTAGDNPNSKLLETSTWIDPKVSETVSKYCILLHILEGSSEALNFSAIYPQQSFPCITAVGYNGVLLWQKEGFVHADMLASSLEKAWLSLHVQETTAAFLTAAIAKQSASGSSEVASPEQVRAGTGVPTSTTNGATPSVGAGQPLHSETKENGTYFKGDDVALPKPAIANALDNGELDESISETETGNASRNLVEIGQNNPRAALPLAEENLDGGDAHLSDNREIVKEASEVARVDTVEKAEASSSTTKSNDVFLNIRLPDGSSLQVKLSMTDTLKMVKDYINENQTSSLGSFSIAIPYPRKVFNDQDMDEKLSELGLSNRQALIVVPQKQNNSQYRGGSSQYQSHSSNEAGSLNASEGYWGSVKRILSYANIFSYLGRSNSTSVAQESQSGGMWQYSPNPSLHNTLRDAGRVPGMQSSEQSAPAMASGSNSRRRPLTSSYGGNIHTLKHDDDDDRFNDKNAFWNGNSTQFGGNDDRK
ncbi:plant UBX domain-containing protein 11 isoform X2 [Salvia miltiorrhiza]|uniref:plant UBX domain-containing protein 11 isoform X2 n=1 Tax=Salvia miltiorrhiza TaxID=226208 RepID=UPI0025AD569A|nr:plant UBX domain-containing protein 11 isoform X2 [Salvia miltiorrhiza]